MRYNVWGCLSDQKKCLKNVTDMHATTQSL